MRRACRREVCQRAWRAQWREGAAADGLEFASRLSRRSAAPTKQRRARSARRTTPTARPSPREDGFKVNVEDSRFVARALSRR